MKWLLSLSILSFSCFAAEPSPTAPQLVVQDIFTRASAPEIATEAKKQEEVNSLVDFDTLAKSALGKNAKGVNATEFAWFRDTLKEIITRTVYPRAPDFLKDVKITYKDTGVTGEKAKISSTVQNKADLTDVDYQLALRGGNWRVVDVAIAGQSWVESIRDQVTQVIKKKKWTGLKESMSRRLNDLKSGKA